MKGGAGFLETVFSIVAKGLKSLGRYSKENVRSFDNIVNCCLCGQPTKEGYFWVKDGIPSTKFADYDILVDLNSKIICPDCYNVLNSKNGLLGKSFVASGESIDLFENCSNRKEINEKILNYILNPPEPPFVIALAPQMFKKHTILYADVAYDKELFPINYGEKKYIIERNVAAKIVEFFKELLENKFKLAAVVTYGNFSNSQKAKTPELVEKAKYFRNEYLDEMKLIYNVFPK